MKANEQQIDARLGQAWAFLTEAFRLQGFGESEVEEGLKRMKSEYSKLVKNHQYEDGHAEVMIRCMTDFLGIESSRAKAQVAELRKDCGDMFCHDDAFEMACHLAGIHARPKIEKIIDDNASLYDILCEEIQGVPSDPYDNDSYDHFGL